VIFLELAAQGVRGVAPAGGRATLRPGYNVVQADGAVLRRVVEALLYPQPKDGDAFPRVPGGPPGAPMRAGLTAVGNDKLTYRLVRDFATGAQLHRFDGEKRSFALVTQELAEIAAFMERTIGAPPRRRLGALLAIAAAELPSKAGGGAGGPAPSIAPQRSSLTPEQTQKRLAALRAELERAKIAEKLQFQLDGLQAQLFKLDEALKAGAKLRDGLATAEAARAEVSDATAAVERLGDPEARLAAFEKATARKAEAAERVAAERAALAEVEERGAPGPFWKDPLFWAGAGGGLGVALVAAIGSAAYPDVRYLAMLDVPMFGWAAWVGLRWVGALEAWERVARRRRAVDDWERKVEAQYERDAAAVRDAMKALGVSRPEDLKEALGRTADADAVVAEWRRRIEEWEASPEARSASSERARVEKALRDVEAKLAAEAGGFVRDVRSVEMEIHRLESEAAGPAAPAPAPPPAPRIADPFRHLLEQAAAELGGSPVSAGRTASQKASQALVGLSFQRLQAVVVDDRGNLQVQTGGRTVAATTLPAADKDLVWLALKLALLEQALAAGKLVAVVDDAFAGLSDGARRFAARLLKQMAKPGQIVHATSDAAFREAADHSA
jgi:hypothetical protein